MLILRQEAKNSDWKTKYQERERENGDPTCQVKGKIYLQKEKTESFRDTNEK